MDETSLEAKLINSVEEFQNILGTVSSENITENAYSKLSEFSSRLAEFINKLKTEPPNSTAANEVFETKKPNLEDQNPEMSLRYETFSHTADDYAKVLSHAYALDPEGFPLLTWGALNEKKKGTNSLYCSACRVFLSEPKDLATHIIQANHKYEIKRELTKLQNSKIFTHLEIEEDIWLLTEDKCELCSIKYSLNETKNIHKKSSRHKNLIYPWRRLSRELAKMASRVLNVPVSYICFSPNCYLCVFCIEKIDLRNIISHALSKHKDVKNIPLDPVGFLCLICQFKGSVYDEIRHDCLKYARIICSHCNYILIAKTWIDVGNHLLNDKNCSNKVEKSENTSMKNKENDTNKSSSSTPPSLSINSYLASPYSLQTFSDRIALKAHSENEKVYSRQDRIILFIKEQLSKIFNGEKPEIIIPFGSRITGMYLEDSDLDVYIELDSLLKRHKKPRAYNQIGTLICQALQEAGPNEIANCHKPVENIPRVRFRHVSTKTEVDLSFIKGVGIYNTQLMKLMAKIEPNLINLVRVIKIWAKEHELNNYPQFTTHCLMVLIMFYLQITSEGPFLPSVKSLKQLCENKSQIYVKSINVTLPELEEIEQIVAEYNIKKRLNLHELTSGFFFFLVEFEWEAKAISPFYGKSYPQKFLNQQPCDLELNEYFIQTINVNKKLTRGGINQPMIVQDPIDLCKNVAESITNETLINLKKIAATSALSMLN